MSDTTYIVTVLVIAIGGLAGVAYFLDKRRNPAKRPLLELPPLGPMGRILLWAIRVLVVAMVLLVISAFVSGRLYLVWGAGICLIFYLIFGSILRIVRLSGK